MTPQPAFTAAEFALVLNVSPRAILADFEGVAETALKVVAGNRAKAWPVSALPESRRSELQTIAERKGYRSIEHLLQKPVERWQPATPLNVVSTIYVQKAIKLQKVCQPVLQRLDDLTLTRAEIEQQGRADYKAEFGYEISEEHFRRILNRTLDRDNGLREWHRVELFLDDNIGRQKPATREEIKLRFVHTPLDEIVAHLDSKDDPTPEDKEWLFDSAFKHYETILEQCQDDRERKALKGSLIGYLFAAVPGLSKNDKALRRVFEMKYADWISGGRKASVLSDERRLKSGNFRAPEFKEDKVKIRNLAILHNGNEALAHRVLRQKGELSPEFTAYYSFNPRKNKSYVPNVVRSDITPEVDMCASLHRGPWEAKMRGPYIPRDWSDVQPGDYFSGDDVTWNNYFYFYDEDGLHIERGECLLMTDLRSGYPLDFVLIAGKYNGRHIRSLLTKIHDKHGLPHVGMYFEKGVWASRWIDGDKRAAKYRQHWRETENGLGETGLDLQVRHATTPRAKTIEGLIRILQERQRSEPGFVGFNERLQKMERMQEFIQRARSGKEHPGNEMLEMGEWVNRISRTLEEFAADPQNGKMLPGISPGEAWQAARMKTPLRKLPDECRYLLATHKQPVFVRESGIVLNTVPGKPLYADEKLNPFINREVLAFYNIDNPELLTVSDLGRKNYFTVKRVIMPAMSATKEQFAEVRAQVRGQMKAAKTIYGTIQHKVISTVARDDQHSEQTKELGRFHNEAEATHKEEQSALTRKLRKIQTNAVELGTGIAANVRNPDTVLKGQALEREALANIQQAEQPAQPAQKKTYVLNSPKPATTGQFWRVWNQTEKLKPGLNRHAITHKALGYVKPVNAMNAEELARCIEVFSAILRDDTKALQTS